jgi:hypothetical protein
VVFAGTETEQVLPHDIPPPVIVPDPVPAFVLEIVTFFISGTTTTGVGVTGTAVVAF